MATTFTNQATLSYNGGNSILSTVAVGAIEGVLSVAKNATTENYSVGDTVTYVVSITNNGDTAADLTVTDNLGAYDFNSGSVQPLTYVERSVQYYSDGVLQTAPSVTTTDGLEISGITVPANGNALIIYSATVNEYAPRNTDSTIENTVTVAGTNYCDVIATDTITASSVAQPAIIKTVSPVPVAENGELTYTFQLQNTGNTAITTADNAVISDTFNPPLSNISVTLNGEALTANSDYTYNEVNGEFETSTGTIEIPAATFEQNENTGVWAVTPGTATLVITGTVGGPCDITT